MPRLRASDHLDAVARDYPGVWRTYDRLLVERGRGLPDWPAWCHCPLAAAYAVVSSGGVINPDLRADIARVGALAAWRPTQGVYRFDETVLDALWSSSLDGDIPVTAIQRLPEWCVYVETPGKTWLAHGLHGFFAHLEHDANNGDTELRLLLDSGVGLTGIPIHLGSGRTVERGLLDTVAEAAVIASRSYRTIPDFDVRRVADSLTPLVSTLLYLCAGDADTRATRGRGAIVAALKQGKTGAFMPPARCPEVWETGFALGKAIREASCAPRCDP